MKSIRNLWLQGLRGRTRMLLAWVFVALSGFLQTSGQIGWEGMCLGWIGVCLRVWSSGYLSKDTEPAVSGPFCFVRNPLYLGSFLIAIGLCWSLYSWSLLLMVTLVFWLVHEAVIIEEEERLLVLFGRTYALYCKAVPRLIPFLGGSDKVARKELFQLVAPRPFSWKLAKKNRFAEAILSFVGIYFWLYLVGILKRSIV